MATCYGREQSLVERDCWLGSLACSALCLTSPRLALWMDDSSELDSTHMCEGKLAGLRFCTPVDLVTSHERQRAVLLPSL